MLARISMLAVMLLAALPAMAHADVNVTYDDGTPSDTELKVTDEGGNATTIAFFYRVNGVGDADNTFEIVTGGGNLILDGSAMPLCSVVTATKVTCEHYDSANGFHRLDRIRVEGKDDNDVLSLEDATMTAANIAGTGIIMHGGDGEDDLQGTGADDIIEGGNGDDVIKGHAGEDKLYGDAGIDRLRGGDDGDVLEGGDGADDLDGEAGTDDLTGESGDDTLVSEKDGVVDTFDGGADDDSIYLYSDAAVTVTLGDDVANDGPDNENFRADIENVHGTEFNDTLTLAGDTKRAFGQDGNDTLTGNAQDNTLDGGDGNDTLRGNDGVDVMNGGDGRDGFRVEPDGSVDTYSGGAGAQDYIIMENTIAGVQVTLGDVAGDDGPDNETFPADIEAIQGTDFDDTLTMGPTSKEAYGQGGNDTITGNAITEVIYGGDGDDVIRGGDGGEELYGDAGDDLINGGGGTDEIQGGDGNDILEPIELVGIWDTVHGGAGDDWVYMTGAVGPVTVTLGEGVNGDGPDDEDYGADIENVRGTEFDDDLLGGGIIDGGGGADTLRARDGATLIGGPGIDSYVQASGTSHTVSYAKDTTGITMNGASVTVDGGTETLPATALIVIGSPFADTMTGRAAIVDTLKGGDGNDTIELRDGTVDGVADCGAGTDSIRSDTGTVTDPDPIGCESGNPVVPPAADPGGDTGGGGTGTGGGGGGTTAEPTPVTARLTGVTSSVERYRCPRSQQSRGVKVGRAFWCLRLTVRGRVLDSAHDDAAIAGQLVGAFRVSGQKLSKLGEGSTSATGAFVVRRAVTVPARYRRTLAQASSYAARQHQRVHVLHTVRGEVVAATALRVRTLEPSRLVRTSSRLGRYACRAREQRLGVREGAMRWCYWLSVRSTLRRSIDNAPLARQRVNVYRVVGQRQRLLGSTRSDRRGNVLLVQTVIVPAAHRSSTAKANRWLAAQYRTTRLRHFAAGSSTTGSAPVVNLRTRR